MMRLNAMVLSAYAEDAITLLGVLLLQVPLRFTIFDSSSGWLLCFCWRGLQNSSTDVTLMLMAGRLIPVINFEKAL